VLSLMQKFVNLGKGAQQDETMHGITSAIAVDGLKEHIYVEAMKEQNVKEVSPEDWTRRKSRTVPQMQLTSPQGRCTGLGSSQGCRTNRGRGLLVPFACAACARAGLRRATGWCPRGP